MKLILSICIVLLILMGCCGATTSAGKDGGRQNEVSEIVSQSRINNLLTLADAEKILGEPAHRSDSTLSEGKRATTFHGSFTANAVDTKTGKTGSLYFLAEEYRDLAAAQKRYTFIYDANKNNGGVVPLQDLGDEAYFHTDSENFYFIMVRKGMKVFNMKVNKITSNTSLEQFREVAKRITESI